MRDINITINGVPLSQGAAMSVLVAVQSFITKLNRKKYPLGRDKHGIAIKKAYLANLAVVNSALIRTNDREYVSPPCFDSQGFTPEQTDYINTTAQDFNHALQRAGVAWPTHEIAAMLSMHIKKL